MNAINLLQNFLITSMLINVLALVFFKIWVVKPIFLLLVLLSIMFLRFIFLIVNVD